MTVNNSQIVEVIEVGSEIEEEVVLRSESYQLVCFAGNRPTFASVGKICHVILTFLILDDYEVTSLSRDVNQSIERLGDGFQYKIVGRLIEGRLRSCGFEFRDDAFETEFEHLNGEMVAIRVDRINVDFLGAV